MEGIRCVVYRKLIHAEGPESSRGNERRPRTRTALAVDLRDLVAVDVNVDVAPLRKFERYLACFTAEFKF
jgi:hypothetical protein